MSQFSMRYWWLSFIFGHEITVNAPYWLLFAGHEIFWEIQLTQPYISSSCAFSGSTCASTSLICFLIHIQANKGRIAQILRQHPSLSLSPNPHALALPYNSPYLNNRTDFPSRKLTCGDQWLVPTNRFRTAFVPRRWGTRGWFLSVYYHPWGL